MAGASPVAGAACPGRARMWDRINCETAGMRRVGANFYVAAPSMVDELAS